MSRVSSRGWEPRWRADGRELFFVVPEPPDIGHLMAVSVEPDTLAGPRVGIPRELFATRVLFNNPSGNIFSYSPDRAGDRFLVNVLANDAQPTVDVITNWQRAVGGQASDPLC